MHTEFKALQRRFPTCPAGTHMKKQNHLESLKTEPLPSNLSSRLTRNRAAGLCTASTPVLGDTAVASLAIDAPRFSQSGCSELWAIFPQKWHCMAVTDSSMEVSPYSGIVFKRKARDSIPERADCCDWLLSQELSSNFNYIKDSINQICCSQFYPPAVCVHAGMCTCLLKGCCPACTLLLCKSLPVPTVHNAGWVFFFLKELLNLAKKEKAQRQSEVQSSFHAGAPWGAALLSLEEGRMVRDVYKTAAWKSKREMTGHCLCQCLNWKWADEVIRYKTDKRNSLSCKNPFVENPVWQPDPRWPLLCKAAMQTKLTLV